MCQPFACIQQIQMQAVHAFSAVLWDKCTGRPRSKIRLLRRDCQACHINRPFRDAQDRYSSKTRIALHNLAQQQQKYYQS